MNILNISDSSVQHISVRYGHTTNILDEDPPLKIGPQCEKTCNQWFGNNKGAYQHACQRSLISVFVIHVLERIRSRLATSEISIS